MTDIYYFNARGETSKTYATTRIISAIVDMFLLAILVWYITPESFTDMVPLVARSKVVTWLLAGCYGAMSVEMVVAKKRFTGLALTSLFALGYMTLISFFSNAPGHETKIFGNDELTFLGLVCGLLWAPNRREAQVLKSCRIGAIVSVTAVALTLAGLLIGFVEPGLNATKARLYTQSLWSALFATASLLPYVAVTTRGDWARKLRTRLGVWALGIGTLFAGAGISATRSVLVQTLICLASSVFLVLRNRKAKLVALTLLASAAAIALMSAGARFAFLKERTESTVASEEERYVEVRRLFEQLDVNILTGWGVGSLFDSPVVLEEYGKAAVPHIGVFAFIQKGGILVFIMFVCYPLFRCVSGLFSLPRDTIAYAAASSMAVYFGTASLSGGWTPMMMFIYGVGLSEIVYRSRAARFRGVSGDGPPGGVPSFRQAHSVLQ